MDVVVFLMQHTMISLVIVFILSLLVGSFLNVVIYRLPLILKAHWEQECYLYLGLSAPARVKPFNLCWPLSHCPHCRVLIKPWYNIPLLSYIGLRGKCHFCHSSISIRYLVVEAITGMTSVWVSWHFGWTSQTVVMLCFTWVSIALAFIDAEHHWLPDQLTLFLLWLGLFCSLFPVFASSYNAIIGAISGYLFFATIQNIFYWISGKEGMGQGDFKYLAALGALFGWQVLPDIVLYASVSGIIGAVIHMFRTKNFTSIPLPFGPYLVIAGWIVVLWYY